jgi:hypothetical protein
MKYKNIAQTLKGNGCYAGQIGKGERAVVAAVHPMSFRAVFESLQKLPATRDRPMVQTHVGRIPTREMANCGPNGLALHAIQFLPEPFDCSTAAEIIGETSP